MNKTKHAYDRWSEIYDSEPNSQKVLEEDGVLDLVSPSSGDLILDAACGTGRYCQLFQDGGADVLGLDFSEGMLSVARVKLPDIEFKCANLELPLPFPDEMFNKINCAQALKHISDLHPTLSEFSRIIVPGGTITFSVTHPDMNWENYVVSYSSIVNLKHEAEVYHHRFCDYFQAIAKAGLKLSGFRQVPVNATIREYLTPESYEKVKGRYQIAIFHSVKEQVQPIAGGGHPR